MECIYENDKESIIGLTCKMGYPFCEEDKCPDYKPKQGDLNADAF